MPTPALAVPPPLAQALGGTLELAGTDVSKPAVQMAAKRRLPQGAGITWAVANNRHLPFAAGHIDLILSMFGFCVWEGFKAVQAPGGRVLIDGKEVAGQNKFVPPEKRGVGLMFQDFALFPHLSILDNVAFGLRSLTRAEARAEALAALARVGLDHYASEYPHILSGGEQQRVALARAIAPRPAVLLMDEPFSGLDPELREKMREETLAILRETGATCVVVTHDAEEAMRMGDRVALLRKGRVIQIGTPLDLYRAPTDITAARTFSDLNEIPARVEAGRAITPIGSFPALNLKDGTAIVCVRQRGVGLAPAGTGIPGRVRDVRYLGDVALAEVAVQGLDIPLLARLRESDAPLPGAEVGVQVDEGAVLVFAAERAAVPAS